MCMQEPLSVICLFTVVFVFHEFSSDTFHLCSSKVVHVVNLSPVSWHQWSDSHGLHQCLDWLALDGRCVATSIVPKWHKRFHNAVIFHWWLDFATSLYNSHDVINFSAHIIKWDNQQDNWRSLTYYFFFLFAKFLSISVCLPQVQTTQSQIWFMADVADRP